MKGIQKHSRVWESSAWPVDVGRFGAKGAGRGDEGLVPAAGTEWGMKGSGRKG